MKQIVSYPSTNLLKVLADGMISHPSIAGAFFIPVVIVDAAKLPALAEMVRLHGQFADGDVLSQWATHARQSNLVMLMLSFLRPIELQVAIEFDLNERAALVDAIVTAKSFYLQPGKVGDRVSDDITAPKILVEVTQESFPRQWEKIFFRVAMEKAKAGGARRQEAKRVARDWIAILRQFTGRQWPGA